MGKITSWVQKTQGREQKARSSSLNWIKTRITLGTEAANVGTRSKQPIQKTQTVTQMQPFKSVYTAFKRVWFWISLNNSNEKINRLRYIYCIQMWKSVITAHSWAVSPLLKAPADTFTAPHETLPLRPFTTPAIFSFLSIREKWWCSPVQ